MSNNPEIGVHAADDCSARSSGIAGLWSIGVTSRLRSSYEKGCQGKKHLPAPLEDAGVVTYIQPHLIPHLILRGGIGLVALARRTFPRQCQPQLLVPTRRFHEVSGARRRSVPKLRKLSVGLSANQDPLSGSRSTPFLGYPRGHRIDPETRCWTTAHRVPE